MSSNPALTGKLSCPPTSSHTSAPAHVDYLLVVSPGQLTHSQTKVNKLRRNSHTEEEASTEKLILPFLYLKEEGKKRRNIDLCFYKF